MPRATERNGPSGGALRAAWTRRALLLDGGLGTELMRSAAARAWPAGPGTGVALERANLERPELVLEVARSYLAAGCDAVTTNTFCADVPTLERLDPRLAARATDAARAAAHLARRAADEFATPRQPRFVIGSIGPGLPLPRGSTRARRGELERRERAWGELARALLDGGVDALALETVRDPDGLAAALRAARSACERAGSGSALIVSCAPARWADVVRFEDGTPLASAVAHACAQVGGVDLAAINCAPPGRATRRALAELAEASGVAEVCGAIGVTGVTPVKRPAWGALGAWPSAGPRMSTERWARSVAACARRFDLRLVGGCCGTTAAHLRALTSLS